MNQLIRLNPKPGGVVSTINKAETYVIPDFFIENISSKLGYALNNRNAPELRIGKATSAVCCGSTNGAAKRTNSRKMP